MADNYGIYRAIIPETDLLYQLSTVYLISHFSLCIYV